MQRFTSGALVAATVALCVGVGGVAEAVQAPPIRGVNLGGWLVLESWITPSVFSDNGVDAGVGEWEFCAHIGSPSDCAAALQQHWASWVNETHIQALAAAGITNVRIPLGYWILGPAFVGPGEPYAAGAGWPHLLRALTWVKDAGMTALLDLHGAPGSQNGHDNSGQSSGGIHWQEPANVNHTVDVLVELAKRSVALNANATTANVIDGIELLNEPWTTQIGGPISLDLLRSFYERAYTAIRDVGFDGRVVISDGWALSDPAWQGFLAPPQAQNVFFDTHIYHCFGGVRDQPTPWANVAYTCEQDAPLLAGLTKQDWVLTGEWSLARTGSAPALPDHSTPSGRAWLRAFWASQVQAYCPACWSATQSSSPAKGSYFWNFRIEDADGTGRFAEWNYLFGLQDGYIGSYNSSGAVSTEFDFVCSEAYPLSVPAGLR